MDLSVTVLPLISDAVRTLWPRTVQPGSHDRATVASIREAAGDLQRATDASLADRSMELRRATMFVGKRPSADRLKRAFALVCEAARRVLGIDYYDVQVLAGLALSRRCIAEMQTGEGKTFVAAFPAFFFALAGRGVHVMTVNAYLSNRDCELLRPLYELLGMTVGNLKSEDPPDAKRAAYRCDITYGPGYEYGFDYLRDQAALLARQKLVLGEAFLGKLRGSEPQTEQVVQARRAVAIVDEVDSVLLDEATSPLVLAEGLNQPAEHPEIYTNALAVARQLVEGVDFVVNSVSRLLVLTDNGTRNVEREVHALRLRGLQRPWACYVEQALRAERLFRRDREYVVDDDKVHLVDEATGRIFSDRTLRQGLHQAIEAKENVPITSEQRPLARISRQRYFGLYDALCGMTGTASGNEREFWSVYRLPVVRVPLRRPVRRHAMPHRFFGDQRAKWRAIAESVDVVRRKGQPVLVGTRTIASSQHLAGLLESAGIPFQLLNGMQDAEEAEIIARAGHASHVTVATNMAGRGTDIQLGPGAEHQGGLHVIVSEPHESARVDRQLVGRAARQGDPGSCQTFVAADDPLILMHGPALGQRMKRIANAYGEVDVDLTAEIARLQRKAERRGFAHRKQVMAHDDWLDDVLSLLAGEA